MVMTEVFDKLKALQDVLAEKYTLEAQIEEKAPEAEEQKVEEVEAPVEEAEKPAARKGRKPKTEEPKEEDK